MKKKGFVFVESIVVLVVVALSLSMLISSYSLVSRKTKEKEFYNKASDKYLLYSLSNIGTDDKCNYGMECNDMTMTIDESKTFFDSKKISFRADKEGGLFACNNTKIGKIIFNCEAVFDELNLVHVYVVDNILDILYPPHPENENCSKSAYEINPSSCRTYFFDSGTLEFMKSLKKCKDDDYDKNKTSCSNSYKYLIGVFERTSGEYHYAAIEV